MNYTVKYLSTRHCCLLARERERESVGEDRHKGELGVCEGSYITYLHVVSTETLLFDQ